LKTFSKLSIDASATGYFAEYSLPGDRNTFVFSKLQDGETFNVKVEYIVVPYKSETETTSAPLCGQFSTKPLAPTNFRIGSDENEISWTKSSTVSVKDYKVKYRSSEEGSKAEEFYVQNVSSEDQEVSAKLMVTCFQILSKFLIFSIVPESGSRHSLQDQYLRTGN